MSRSKNVIGVTSLADAEPIAYGHVRQIWDRPGYPDQILKTIQPGKVQKFASRPAYRRAIDDIRYGPYRSFRIEYRYYARTAFKCLKAGRSNPIAEMGGLIVTDRGLAQVCEKITDSSGALAKTLQTLIRERSLDDTRVGWLNEFAKSLFILNVSVPDLHVNNVVFDEVRGQFLVVDGYGDKAKIPLRAFFRCLNYAKLDARFARMAEPGYLEWDSTLKKYSLV